MPPPPEGEVPPSAPTEELSPEIADEAAEFEASEFDTADVTATDISSEPSAEYEGTAFTDTALPVGLATKPSTLTLEEASTRIGPKVLQALEEKFNGNLIEVRARNEKDQFFQ